MSCVPRSQGQWLLLQFSSFILQRENFEILINWNNLQCMQRGLVNVKISRQYWLCRWQVRGLLQLKIGIVDPFEIVQECFGDPAFVEQISWNKMFHDDEDGILRVKEKEEYASGKVMVFEVIGDSLYRAPLSYPRNDHHGGMNPFAQLRQNHQQTAG